MENITDLTTVLTSSLNTTSSGMRRTRRQTQNWIIAGLLFSVVVVNLCGNSLVVAVIWKRMKKTSPGIGALLVSLATADLGSGIFSALPSAFRYTYGTWKLGRFMCKIHSFSRALLSNASAGTLVIIGIERFRTLGKQNAAGLSQKKCIIAVLILWVYNIVFSIHGLLIFDTIHMPEVTECGFRSDLDAYMDLIQVLAFFTRVVNFMLPLGILIVCYSGVIYRMWSSARKVASTSMASTSKNKQIRRVTKTCVLIVVVFAISSAPEQIVILYSLYNMHNVTIRKVHAACWVLYLSATCINPVIYGLMWGTFRQHAKEMLESLCLKAFRRSTEPQQQTRQTQLRVTELRPTQARNLLERNQIARTQMQPKQDGNMSHDGFARDRNEATGAHTSQYHAGHAMRKTSITTVHN